MSKRIADADRIDRRIERIPFSGCWIWTGKVDRAGYGVIEVHHKTVFAHRFSYQAMRGVIPNGLVIDHLCRVPSCINPDHLEPVSMRENVIRGISFAAKNGKKTHCLNGHEFSPANTSLTKYGQRQCKKCALVRRQAKNKGA